MTADLIIAIILWSILVVVFGILPIIFAVSDDITFRKALKGDEEARRRLDAQLGLSHKHHTK